MRHDNKQDTIGENKLKSLYTVIILAEQAKCPPIILRTYPYNFYSFNYKQNPVFRKQFRNIIYNIKYYNKHIIKLSEIPI